MSKPGSAPASTSLPSRARIARHWFGVANDSADLGKVESRPWWEAVPRFLHNLYLDPAEVCCMGCGRYFGCLRTNDRKSSDPFAIYDKYRLTRCHLLPASKGGDVAPGNLVLLCTWCHKEAPDVSDPRYMLEWLNGREDAVRQEMERQALAAWKAYSTPWKELDLLDLGAHIREHSLEDDFERFRMDFVGLHRDPDRGPILKIASTVACWFAYAKKIGWGRQGTARG